MAATKLQVKNPFEEADVVGITNYIDLGFEFEQRSTLLLTFDRKMSFFLHLKRSLLRVELKLIGAQILRTGSVRQHQVLLSRPACN